MSATKLADVQNQMQTKWSKLFVKELRAMSPLPELVTKDYRGEIQNQHSQVVVSMVRKVQGQTRTAGVDADTFESSPLVFDDVTVQSNKRFVAATEITELSQLQSQLDDPAMQSAVRDALLRGVIEQWENFLWGLVNPSASAPDHLITGKNPLAAADLIANRVLAGQAKWGKDKPWYGLLDPVYYGDLLGAGTLTNVADTGNSDAPVIGGQFAQKRYNFQILEDNSRGSRKGLFFHPDFLISVIQKEAKFEISSLHSQKKFGYLVSVDLFGGAKLNIEGGLQHIYTTAGTGLDMNG